MYSITSKDRRVTNYVKKQAYKWIYDKIIKNEYESHSNDSDNVLLRIRQNKCVDESSYEEFLDYFNNDPYYYMINNDSPKKLNCITTRVIDNYFIKFNEELLPVGFIKSFFEDDYETMADVAEFNKMYLDGTLDGFFINCMMTRNRRDEEIEAVKDKNSKVFNTSFGYHFINILIKIVLPLIAAYLGVKYFIGSWIAGTLSARAEAFAYDFAINLLGVILMFLNTIRAFTHISFYVRWIGIRIYVSGLGKALRIFDSDTMDSFKEHFRNINRYLVTNPIIADDPCFEAPLARKQYLYIVDFNKKTLENKLSVLMRKFSDKVNILLGRNKWFSTTIHVLFWTTLLFMVNSSEYSIYIRRALDWLGEIF